VLTTGCATAGHPSPAASSAAASAPPAQQIAFGRFENDGHTIGEVIIENADGSHERKLTTPPMGMVDETPDWSPDGSELVFVRWTPQSEQIFAASADGSNVRALTPVDSNPTGLADATAGRDEHPVYSPDGTKVAFVHISGDEQNSVRKHADVWVMGADGGSPSDVTQLPDYAGEVDGVEWSPNGKQLVYSVFNDTPGASFHGGALFTIDVDGTHSHRLTDWKLDAGGVPDWSSATGLIAFRAVTDLEPGYGNIDTIRPAGTGLHRVTRFSKTALSSKVSVSADGAWLLFAKGDQKAIFIERDDGTSLGRVGISSYYDSAPDWGPRG
jgi:Tol biopolymer transport system component